MLWSYPFPTCFRLISEGELRVLTPCREGLTDDQDRHFADRHPGVKPDAEQVVEGLAEPSLLLVWVDREAVHMDLFSCAAKR